MFALVEISTNKNDNFQELEFSEKIKRMLKGHPIFYSLFMTLSVAYYFININEPVKEHENQNQYVTVNKIPIKKVAPKGNWIYEEYEGNKIASLQSNNSVNIIPEKIELKVTFLYIEYLKFSDNSEQSYIKITKAKGRHPCWDEEQYCHLSINGQEFKLKKGENFQEMQIENTEDFIKTVKANSNIKITTPMTIQPIEKEAFVENRDFYFNTNGLK